MKLVVPTGYMIGQGTKYLTIEMCDNPLGEHSVRQIAIPVDTERTHKNAQAKEICPFASLSFAWASGAAPDLLGLALLFILALGFVSIALPPTRQVAFLRPPLRGPPLRV